MMHVVLPPALSSTPAGTFFQCRWLNICLHNPTTFDTYHSGLFRDRCPLRSVYKTSDQCFVSTTKSETFQIRRSHSRRQVHPSLPPGKIDHGQEALRTEKTGAHVPCFQSATKTRALNFQAPSLIFTMTLRPKAEIATTNHCPVTCNYHGFTPYTVSIFSRKST
jgi:hypothetical protein